MWFRRRRDLTDIWGINASFERNQERILSKRSTFDGHRDFVPRSETDIVNFSGPFRYRAFTSVRAQDYPWFWMNANTPVWWIECVILLSREINRDLLRYFDKSWWVAASWSVLCLSRHWNIYAKYQACRIRHALREKSSSRAEVLFASGFDQSHKRPSDRMVDFLM